MNSFVATLICSLIKNRNRRRIVYDLLTRKLDKEQEENIYSFLYEKRSIDFQGVSKIEKKLDAVSKKLHSSTELIQYCQQMFFNELYKSFLEEGADVEKEFFRNMLVTSSLMKDEHAILDWLLRQLDMICREHRIDYWLSFGALIGAVRHGGNIPWDDDIDVCMMRSDIGRLMEIMKDHPRLYIKEMFGIWSQFYHVFRLQTRNSEIPLFLDIFVMDFTDKPVKEFSNRVYESRRRMYEQSVLVGKNKDYIGTDKEFGALKTIFDIQLEKMVEDGFISFSKGKNIGWGIDNFTTDRAVNYAYGEIFPLELVVFNGKNYFVQRNYRSFLYERYGDIYKLPEDMVSHQHIKLDARQRKAVADFVSDIIGTVTVTGAIDGKIVSS